MAHQLYDRTMTELERGDIDFAIRDLKGRAVGYGWVIFKAVYSPAKAGATSGYTMSMAPLNNLPLEHLMIAAFPTRNGKHYGALSGYLHCITHSEAMALLAKRVKQARARERKRFGTLGNKDHAA